jgi:hypothetical protein
VHAARLRLSANSTKKARSASNDELRPEYDLSKLKGGVRGKYYREAIKGTNVVLIDPDLASVFPDSEAVNRALRVIAEAALAAKPLKTRRAR